MAKHTRRIRDIREEQYVKQAMERVDFLTVLLVMLIQQQGGEATIENPDQYKGQKMTLNYRLTEDGSFKLAGRFIKEELPITTPESAQNAPEQATVSPTP